MSNARRALCIFYAVMATAALVATWSQNIAYFQGGRTAVDGLTALVGFLGDMRVNAASRSIGVDVALVCLAAMTFMIVEARRLGIRYVWAYIALGFIVAISVSLPLFLIARERHLAWEEGGAGPLALADGIGIAAVSAAVAALGGYILG